MAEAVWGPGGRLFSLTARQAVVLDKLRAGRLPKQIAQDLDISYETVRKHTAALRLRLGKKTAAMLAESSLLFDAAMRGGGVCLGGALTLREQEVARWLGAGYGVREVAGLLAIAPATVCKHRENIYRKLGVSNVNGLVLSLGV